MARPAVVVLLRVSGVKHNSSVYRVMVSTDRNMTCARGGLVVPPNVSAQVPTIVMIALQLMDADGLYRLLLISHSL
jgi:hypothetical protein